jgi:multidrug efflux pump
MTKTGTGVSVLGLSAFGFRLSFGFRDSDFGFEAMISRFFIDRPIFAAVLSIVITLTGVLALVSLPIAQYPPSTPPSVQVMISYPGASAQVVADTVAAPIEQQVNGVEKMLYMSSTSDNTGSYTLTVTFDIGTDLNTALVMVQNRVNLALPQLPTDVQRQGITIRKKTPDILQIISLYSPDGRYDNNYISNYATIHLQDELLRIDGVSQLVYQGQRALSMRAWLDPQKLAAHDMTAADVADAVRAQSVAAAPGQIGQPPTSTGQSFQMPLDALGRLTDPEQFGNIIVKVGRNNAVLSDTGVVQSPTGGALGAPDLTSPVIPNSGPAAASQITGGMPFGRPKVRSTSVGLTSMPDFRLRQTSVGLTLNIAPTGTSPLGLGTPGTSPNGRALPLGAVGGGTTGGGGTGVGGGTTGGGATGAVSTPINDLTAGGASTGGTVGANAVSGGRLGGGPPSPAAAIVRLRDVARVERGAQSYINAATLDGHPSVALSVFQLPGTNALQVGDRVRKKMEELKARFPEGLDYEIAYDTTPFIRESVMDVVYTLLEAVGLVAVVVLVFLQNWRAALIPLIAVPVAIVGTFAVMAVMHYSLNNISLFGLVLAIGIVVDDAIVVVENVERWLEHGLSPKEAARKAMDEVTGPVIAVALVLCAVFVPCAFLGSITGQFFRQFAVTIAASTILSAFNSLTLSPALAAILLRPRGARRDPLTWLLDKGLGWFFRMFNAGFGLGTAAYTRAVGGLLRVSAVVLVAFVGLVVLTYWVFRQAPTGFIPEQDQGRLIVTVQLPDSASPQRTRQTVAEVEGIAHMIPGVAHTTTVSGMSQVLSANASNFATMFVILDPFAKRKSPELSANAIAARLRRECAQQIKDGQVTVLGAPAIPGLSLAGGFQLMVEDRANLGPAFLQQQTDALVGKLRDDPGLVGVSTQFRSATPMLYMAIDRTKVHALGVPLSDVNQTMQIYMGSLYANSYNEFGRYWQVTLQAEDRYRTKVSDVNLLEVRNQGGEMVPLGTLVNLRPVGGPVMVLRYNLYPAAAINGNARPGYSTGEAIAAIGATADQTLPRSMATEWTTLWFLQIRAGDAAMYVFGLAVVFVFLALAALYESWALPLAVILVVPMCLLCSAAGVLFAHRSVDIFVQIGLVVLVGLACKNAILIVEFAQQQYAAGKPRREATLEAVRLRLRPILMTSLAFILGVVPLVIATGAGAEMRQSLGTAVFSGMLGVTLFGIFLTPVFFYVIRGLGETRLFTAATTAWAGSALAGAVLGLAVGFSLARLGVGRLPWSAVGGAGGGAALALLVPVFWRRIRRAAPHAANPVGGNPR